MALVTIKDLPQNDALDREAMRSVVGGGRINPRPVAVEQIQGGTSRIVDYPPGFGRSGPTPVKTQRSG